MKKQKMSTLSTPAQQAKSFLTAAEIGSYEKDDEVYDREKLGLRSDDPVFMKHEVPKKIEFGKPFQCRTLQTTFSSQETPQLVHSSELIGCDKHHISNPRKHFL
jgi:hypothetical protein